MLELPLSKDVGDMVLNLQFPQKNNFHTYVKKVDIQDENLDYSDKGY